MKSATISIKRGLDIKLLGEPIDHELPVTPRFFAVKPSDLPGVEPIPRLLVQAGDRVLSGQPLFSTQSRPEAMVCAPMSGTIAEIRRGAKRSVIEIVIEADPVPDHKVFALPRDNDRSAITSLLLESGAWLLLRQRPFNSIPDPSVVPRDIFISCFDTSPLAPDYGIVMRGKESEFNAGLRVLRGLTEGGVHLGIRADSPDVFRRAEGVDVHMFAGPHPAGLVGIQVHHVAPLARGEAIWTIKPQDVATIGRLVLRGVFDPQRTVAITGPEVRSPGYFNTRLGASVKPAIADNLRDGKVRVIAGNVLTGTRIASDGFLGFFDDQITVIAEGDEPEFLGWLLPGYPRPSMSRTFTSFLKPDRAYRVNSSQHGEKRAFVMTGEYERVCPMDIYPQLLLKAILTRDFERIEGLGIYEVVEEDLALCEFVCTSKQPVQRILREGIEWLVAES